MVKANEVLMSVASFVKDFHLENFTWWDPDYVLSCSKVVDDNEPETSKTMYVNDDSENEVHEFEAILCFLFHIYTLNDASNTSHSHKFKDGEE